MYHKLNVSKASINITAIKKSFSLRYPASDLTHILLREPDELPAEEFLGAVRTWLAILNSEAGP